MLQDRSSSRRGGRRMADMNEQGPRRPRSNQTQPHDLCTQRAGSCVQATSSSLLVPVVESSRIDERAHLEKGIACRCETLARPRYAGSGADQFPGLPLLPRWKSRVPRASECSLLLCRRGASCQSTVEVRPAGGEYLDTLAMLGSVVRATDELSKISGRIKFGS